MWERFSEDLNCPLCGGCLELNALDTFQAELDEHHFEKAEEWGISSSTLCSYVQSGLLLCFECRLWFPVLHGLPILLPYTTASHREFDSVHGAAINKLGLNYESPDIEPVPGERFVLRSFSQEWLDYSYDGVLWGWSYEDREAMFLTEMGRDVPQRKPCRFLEIGCGIGVVTSFAEKHFGGETVGLDLSLAVMRASKRFKGNPFLHFVQASLWKMPFAEGSFDLLYSHGVLHHTYDTHEAFRRVAPLCREGGRTYIWIYGTADTKAGPLRRAAFLFERAVRPVFARMPGSLVNILIAPFAVLYMGINILQRSTGDVREPYNYSRALHAARDRLTPLFAHRTDPETVANWFRDAQYEDIELVEETEAPISVSRSLRMNIGMRGRKK
jgi:SAM-dependent methyltransferase/uncharacterized protein YbaR (Trm112 family)